MTAASGGASHFRNDSASHIVHRQVILRWREATKFLNVARIRFTVLYYGSKHAQSHGYSC